MNRSRRELADPRALESYIRSRVMPRFMERLREIEDELAVHRIRLARAHERLRRACDGDAARFEERWRAVALAWRFDRVNELIRQHNDYYPIERNLPVDPRTGEYQTVNGRPYWREPVGPDYVLEHFPAALPEPAEESA
jgi:hypothetical protein